jgi:hypothetical protein
MKVPTCTYDGVTKAAVPGREPYATAAATLLTFVGCTVRWRSSNSGYAMVVGPDDIPEGWAARPGYFTRQHWLVLTPEPRGPVSFSTLAHEVGHHDLGHLVKGRDGRRKYPRWRQETEAWLYAFDAFERFGLPGVERARKSAEPHLANAFLRALKRTSSPDRLNRRMLSLGEEIGGPFGEPEEPWLPESHRPWVEEIARLSLVLYEAWLKGVKCRDSE